MSRWAKDENGSPRRAAQHALRVELGFLCVFDTSKTAALHEGLEITILKDASFGWTRTNSS